MNNNPFLSKTESIADNKNHSMKNVNNPFIIEKEKSNQKANKTRRKSILFYLEDYDKIVALSKTEGETIVGLLNKLVNDKITNLTEDEKKRYNNFLK